MPLSVTGLVGGILSGALRGVGGAGSARRHEWALAVGLECAVQRCALRCEQTERPNESAQNDDNRIKRRSKLLCRSGRSDGGASADSAAVQAARQAERESG
jgi:hypothetical protein